MQDASARSPKELEELVRGDHGAQILYVNLQARMRQRAIDQFCVTQGEVSTPKDKNMYLNRNKNDFA